MTRALQVGIYFLFLLACSPIAKQVSTIASEKQYHAGFYLIDLESGKVLVDFQGDKYFTPASNTKILTLYAAHFLPDSLPAFYVKKADSNTYIWPVGNPTFLNPELSDSTNYDLLHQADSLIISFPYFLSERMGSGWAWEDYNYSYSPEISALPIYGNLAYFNIDSISGELQVRPSFLTDSLTIELGERFGVRREEWSNQFWVTMGACGDCERKQPLRLTDKMLHKLLADTLHTPIGFDTLAIPNDAKLVYGMPKDSVLKVMMQRSDNFLAEQLLLQAGMWLTDTLNSSIAIDTIQTYLDALLPDTIAWVDGSGLSRYNMVTPRSIVGLWRELIRIYGKERLMSLLAVGGKYGTIEKWYSAEPPIVYGKTGTLRHNHVLSGLLLTKSGKTLLFAYMHNHFNSGSTPIKEEMEQVLYKIHEKY